jgi:hypothetical protein
LRATSFFFLFQAKQLLQALRALPAMLVVLMTGTICFAQTKQPGTLPPAAQPSIAHDADANTTYIFAAIGTLIPTSESYRLNFTNSFVGLPIEISGGLLFPVGRDIFVPFTVRYDRRTANFITGMSMEVTSIEPGVRYYFQRENAHDFRIFGGVEGLLADASVSGSYVVSSDGTVMGTAVAQRDYFNVGLGFDLGLTYPLTPTTSLEAIVHLAAFLADPVANGGLGNIGGISLSAAYCFGF